METIITLTEEQIQKKNYLDQSHKVIIDKATKLGLITLELENLKAEISKDNNDFSNFKDEFFKELTGGKAGNLEFISENEIKFVEFENQISPEVETK